MTQGERLREVQEALHMTQTEFASGIGVTRTAISSIETGVNKMTEQMIITICKVYRVNYDYLTKGEKPMFVKLPEEIIDSLCEQYNCDSLDKKIIIEYVKLKPEQRKVIKEYIKNVLKNVDIFQTLTPEEISKILDITVERIYRGGEDIIKQNANEDDFIILCDGKCHSEKISDSGKASQAQVLKEFAQFEFFGEVPWFRCENRNYIVKADNDCTVLVISKTKFKRLVGTLENILKRKLDIYQKYMRK